jgi:hypothetical protein
MLHDRHDHDAWGVNFTAMTPSHFVLVNQSCFGTDRGPWAGASVILPLDPRVGRRRGAKLLC